jgi:hypothetical protein
MNQQQDTRVSGLEVKKYVQGVRFPANKHDLVEHAVEQEAPRRIIDLLQQMPTPEFGSPNATKLTVYNSVDELIHEIDKIG